MQWAVAISDCTKSMALQALSSADIYSKGPKPVNRVVFTIFFRRFSATARYIFAARKCVFVAQKNSTFFSQMQFNATLMV